MNTNIDKTKVMKIGRRVERPELDIADKQIEQVEGFKYL